MAGDAITNEVIWNIDMEVNLFHAMRGHKPAGVNRHFQMLAIHDRLCSANKKISSEDVWKHLSTLYDLQALNESEIVPFPNKPGDFEFPENEMTELSEKSFPRTHYINTPTPETPKSEGQCKITKTVKQEPKSESKVAVSKSENRSNTSIRPESKSGLSVSSKLTGQTLPINAQDPSPKRTKRTRHIPSTNSSPATPTEPLAKRRR
ncbi:unnamed protein product [Lymnaea stagnalis]|uniref:MRG-binding protein n=1 Tax=Lymnaea stagnalis TaxID=6523 RepID=A0AAV2IN53_LYMST